MPAHPSWYEAEVEEGGWEWGIGGPMVWLTYSSNAFHDRQACAMRDVFRKNAVRYVWRCVAFGTDTMAQLHGVPVTRPWVHMDRLEPRVN